MIIIGRVHSSETREIDRRLETLKVLRTFTKLARFRLHRQIDGTLRKFDRAAAFQTNFNWAHVLALAVEPALDDDSAGETP